MEYNLLYQVLEDRKEIDTDRIRERNFAREHPRFYFTTQMIRNLSILERTLEAQLGI